MKRIKYLSLVVGLLALSQNVLAQASIGLIGATRLQIQPFKIPVLVKNENKKAKVTGEADVLLLKGREVLGVKDSVVQFKVHFRTSFDALSTYLVLNEINRTTPMSIKIKDKSVSECPPCGAFPSQVSIVSTAFSKGMPLAQIVKNLRRGSLSKDYALAIITRRSLTDDEVMVRVRSMVRALEKPRRTAGVYQRSNLN